MKLKFKIKPIIIVAMLISVLMMACSMGNGDKQDELIDYRNDIKKEFFNRLSYVMGEFEDVMSNNSELDEKIDVVQNIVLPGLADVKSMANSASPNITIPELKDLHSDFIKVIEDYEYLFEMILESFNNLDMDGLTDGLELYEKAYEDYLRYSNELDALGESYGLIVT